ncbi:MAG: NF038129 family PEP-CTERM protein, partial [Acidobacteriia bacterium]|nr:NF038129 family PEP-CTERM protein [Terriglobia bacterium]MBV8904237.1 NF038129 family PEP-CTERM protein [Terriglobia bacterium]
QPASLQILDFISDGTLAACAGNVQGFCPTGDVTGTLPGTLTFDNGTVFNDYFDGFTYGNSLSFDVRLYGPSINSPNGTATSGSTFVFSVFSDVGGTIPVLTTDTADGFAATIDVNLDGSTTVTDFSKQTAIAPAASAVPEPNTVVPLGTITALGMLRLRRRKT